MSNPTKTKEDASLLSVALLVLVPKVPWCPRTRGVVGNSTTRRVETVEKTDIFHREFYFFPPSIYKFCTYTA